MKKIFLLVAFFVLGKICLYAQYPLTQQLGSDSTIVISKGATQSRFVNIVFTDTTQANTQRIKNYPGAQIATNGGGIKLWLRNQTATAWIPINTGSGNNIYTIDGTLTGNRTLTGGGYPLTFTGLDKFVVSADSVRFTTGALNLSLTTDSASITKKLSYAGNYHNDYKQFTLVDKGYVDSVVASSPAGTVTSIATNNGSGITGGTITSTGTLAIDTTNVISTKANVTSGLAGKLNISDTAAMLAPYLRAIDTTSLSNRINLKLNISDTASMLGNYLNNVGYGLSKAGQVVSADSATLSNYYLRRKDSLTTTNPLGYVTKQILADTAAAIRSADAGGTVTSVGLTMPAAFNVGNSPITTAGTISVTAAGLVSQYIRGDGTLADFPGGGGGGGASISYYLNGSVNQGTFGGNTYYEMNKTPIFGTGTNFSINADGYIAQFITDAGDPGLLKIPGGNWNFELFFNASSGGGTPTYYVELYKYDGTTFTLIASGSSNPDVITGGTAVEAYFSTLPVPETVLLATDRLAVRIYVTHAGRTITLHTEDNNLCQVITTFTTGITALNGLTEQVQYFTTGTSGTDFNISSSVATHTFNLPTASATNRGALSTTDWTTFNNKVGGSLISGYITKATGTNTIDTSQLFQSNGNIGIGTTSPTGVGGRILHINAGLDSEIHLTNSMSGSGATDGFSIRASSLNSYIYNYGGGLMEFGTNNTPRMRITNLGQVGIGTGTPDSLLTVSLGTHLQRGIRASGLPQAPGTKALRIDASGTLSYADTLIDAGGTVTSVATNNGTGITGGAITTSGTLAIDTLLISTRAWRQKGIDSVAALINNNISGTTNFIPLFSSANVIGNSIMRQSGTSIGINTSPSYTLDILETGSANIGAGTANNKIVITGNDNGGSIATTNTTYINFAPFQVEAMRITSGGVVNMGANFANNFNKLNVGGSATIGYTTNVVGPTDGLSVNGSVGIGLNGASTDSALSVLNGVRFQRGVRMSGLPSAVGTKTLRIDASGTVSVADTLANGISGSGVNNQAAFFTGTNTIAGSSVLVLDGSNIAIGQAAAAQKLSVNGDVSITTINNATTDTDKFLVSDGGVIKYRTGSEVLSDIGAAASTSISGTTNYIPKFTSSSAIGNSILLQGNNNTLSNVFSSASGSQSFAGMFTGQGTSGNTGVMYFGAGEPNGLDPSYPNVRAGLKIYQSWNGSGTDVKFDLFTLQAGVGNNTVMTGMPNGNAIFNYNLGLGVTPSAWGSNRTALQFGALGAIFSDNNVTSEIGANVYISTAPAYTYITSNYATRFTQINGQFQWHQAASGTAGNAISFTQAMTLDASGNLGLGTSIPSYKLDVAGSGAFSGGLRTTAGDLRSINVGSDTPTSGSFITVINASDSKQYLLQLNASYGLDFWNFNGSSFSKRATLTADGNLGLGVTPSAWGTSEAMQFGFNYAFGRRGITRNAYFDGADYRYITTAAATLFQQDGGGQYIWYQAPSGTAGNAISFTQAMTLDASGRLAVGTPSPSTLKVTIENNGGNLRLRNTTTRYRADFVMNTTELGINSYDDVAASYMPIVIEGSKISLMQGNVGIGTTSPATALEVAGSVRAYLNSATSTELFAENNTVKVRLIAGTSSSFLSTTTNHPLIFETNNTERMRITSGGNVGIGTSSPSAPLSLSGSADVGMRIKAGASALSYIDFDEADSGTPNGSIAYNHGTNAMTFATGGSNGEKMRITSGGYVSFNSNTATINPPYLQGLSIGWNKSNGQGESMINWTNAGGGTNNDLTFNFWNNTTFSERMRITSGGEVYIAGTTDQGAYNLQVNGTGVWGAGAYVDGSDSAVKKNIQPLGSSLDLIKQMNPVTFEYQPFYSKDTTTQTGFIAQELQQVLSDKVYKNGIVKEGGQYLGVAYQHLIPLLVKSIQELEAQVQALKSQLNNR